MIARKRIYEKANPSRDAQKIYIFCEGESREIDYFSFFADISSNLQLITIPPENGKTDPVKLKEQAERYFINEGHAYTLESGERDIVWFVIDTDNWEKEGKIRELRSFCSQQNSTMKYQAWNVAQSNPCLEIWLYYHIYSDKPAHDEVTKYNSMKDFVDKKISGGFNCMTMPAYIKDAVVNAEKNYEDNGNGPEIYSTEAFKLGKDIIKYAGPEIERKTRKLR